MHQKPQYETTKNSNRETSQYQRWFEKMFLFQVETSKWARSSLTTLNAK
jgi:hypothetical protein